MAARIEELAEAPAFDAATYSDRLQETRKAAGLEPVQVFDKSKPASIVPFTKWIRGAFQDKVEQLIAYVNQHDSLLVGAAKELEQHERRIASLEAERVPFGSRSG